MIGIFIPGVSLALPPVYCSDEATSLRSPVVEHIVLDAARMLSLELSPYKLIRPPL
jgi:hypothetical protein